MKNRFLLPAEGLSSVIEGAELTLSPEESHHLARVLRMETGEEIEVVDGKGSMTPATIVEAHPKRTRIRLGKSTSVNRRSSVTVVFGIPKANACDFIFHRCTEVGVRAFQPLVTQHSLHPKDWNSERWQKVVVETAKQCQELWFPEVRSPISLADWLTRREKVPLVFCDEEDRAASPFVGKGSEVQLLIGPEGGWSREEISAFRAAGASSMGLGRNRLRAETATLAATVLLKHCLGENLT